MCVTGNMNGYGSTKYCQLEIATWLPKHLLGDVEFLECADELYLSGSFW